MAARYWVGGAGTWSSGNTANWSATSGGAGGASVPTSADTPTFDANSGSGVVTFTNGGVTVGATTINNANIELSLGAAFVTSGALTLTAGTFTTNDYNVTAASLSSSNTNTRTINLGSSTVTLQGPGAVKVNFATSTGLTFNAGTSSIVISTGGTQFDGGGRTFYNVSYTSTTSTSWTVNGANTFNNLTIAGITSSGVNAVSISADQTINGTLTLSAGTNATMRTFVRSDTIGTTRTLTCNAVSATDIDFRDITIAGAAAPVSGTRLGDCKGNSGITFDAPKTVYWAIAANRNWGNSGGTGSWAFAQNGTLDFAAFPLAQDVAVIDSRANSLPSAGTVTVNAAYNIGTIDMSARTSNTMTLATGTNTPAIYGNWINGTGTTLTGTGAMTFAGRGSQTITSAGKTFTQAFTVNSPGGSVTQQDALTTSANTTIASLQLISGTYDANDYNFTASATGSNGGINSAPSGMVRTFALGSGTWTIAGTGNASNAWVCNALNLTVTGAGIINLTSANARNFAGGGIQTYPTINQGGTGTLTITGSNKFAGITNTAIGRVQFSGGTTNEFGAFNLNGVLGNLLQVGSTNTTQAILKAPSWNVGLLSTDAGNNTGLSFTGTDPNYLSISYINGQLSLTSSVYYGATNITAIYYGSTPVSAIYYGADQVF